MKVPFFTIGHSDRSPEEFAALLASAGIAHVVDVRKIPRSRANPQFNVDVLPDWLAATGVSYEHQSGLGGLRGKTQGLPSDVNGWWDNGSFHRYADYALSNQFEASLAHLIAKGHQRRCALMCAEAVWWRCHRRIIADHLLARGEAVFHVMARDRTEPAHLSSGAVVRADGTVVYPLAERPAVGAWAGQRTDKRRAH